MPRREFRNRTNHSMMLSLYLLASFSFLLLVSYLLVLGFHIFYNISLSQISEDMTYLPETLGLVLVSLLAATPFSGAATYVFISRKHTRSNPGIRRLLNWLVRTPVLLIGVGFLYVFSAQTIIMFTSLLFIGAIKLSQRWIQISEKIRSIEIEGMQAMGLSRAVIAYQLFIRRYYKTYGGHFVSTFLYLVALVTPFLFLFTYSEGDFHYLSLEFFFHIAKDQQKTASLALVFVLLHLLRAVLDSKMNYHEVEYG
jgi:hypothetical protein